MITVSADLDQPETLRVSGDVDATFPRVYRDGEMLAFSDGTILRARWQQNPPCRLWRLSPIVVASRLDVIQACEWADQVVGDSAVLEADIDWVLAVHQPGAATYVALPSSYDGDPDDTLGRSGGPWQLAVVMDPMLDDPAPYTWRGEYPTLREADHHGHRFACMRASRTATVLGADGTIAAYWTRTTNRWVNVSAQAVWVSTCFFDPAVELARHTARRPTS